jgi:hypothetical protein
VLDCKAVTQIDVLEQHQIVLILSDKTLFSYSLEALDPDDNNAVAKRPRKICHANFFKSGICLGQQLVASVKTSGLSTTIKVFEPKENMANKSRKSGFAKMLSTGQDQLKPYKEFYIPTESTSIHFLRSKLCVGCTKGFEVVSLETLETQSLLDQADTSLDFVVRKENIKPIHIERMASEFLLCYTDYSFFVNRNGWRTRQDWRIAWEGTPQAFAIFHPYILAFEPSFIEIRHMESGALVHIVTAKNIRWLHTSTREVRQRMDIDMTTELTNIRFSMHSKTKLVTMLSRAWISGRRLKGTNNPWKTTATTRRTERTQLASVVCLPSAKRSELQLAKQPAIAPRVRKGRRLLAIWIFPFPGTEPQIHLSNHLQMLHAESASRPIFWLTYRLKLDVLPFSPNDLVGTCIILHFWLGRSW